MPFFQLFLFFCKCFLLALAERKAGKEQKRNFFLSPCPLSFPSTCLSFLLLRFRLQGVSSIKHRKERVKASLCFKARKNEPLQNLEVPFLIRGAICSNTATSNNSRFWLGGTAQSSWTRSEVGGGLSQVTALDSSVLVSCRYFGRTSTFLHRRRRLLGGGGGIVIFCGGGGGGGRRGRRRRKEEGG